MSEPGTLPWSETVTGGPAAKGETIPPGVPRLPARYRDEGRIAAGGFGEIRRVHDLQLDRVVAMKLLRADVAGAAQIQARFLAETRLTAGLEHPGIVGVYDNGQLDDGRLWFTMREVRGRTFGAVIDEVHAAAGPEGFRETASGWTFRRLVDAFARVCQAVAYAHRRDIVHRDLKPDNVMVEQGGRAVITDFGIARPAPSLTEGAAPASARAPALEGTLDYFAPEQLGLGAAPDARTDIFALGVLLFELFTGGLPFLGDGPVKRLLARMNEPPRDPALLVPTLHPAIRAILLRCLQKDMSERFQRAGDVAVALEAVTLEASDEPAARPAPIASTEPMGTMRV